ncbi:hypothetical protein HK096_009218 [Nowakowskiella sp. JEL0078]|nr:hypothetical protein HK096_009218 [Nowakowskiella sp. JEL0078]
MSESNNNWEDGTEDNYAKIPVDFEHYLEYDDFKPESFIKKKKRDIQSTRMSFVEKPKAITPKTSTRQNTNHQSEIKSLIRNAPKQQSYSKPDTTSVNSKFRFCEHSPITPSDCRICRSNFAFYPQKVKQVVAHTPKKKPTYHPETVMWNCRCSVVDYPCQLDTPRCCICMDRRPPSATYWAYVDGMGYAGTTNRQAFYCPSCRGEITPQLEVVDVNETSQIFLHPEELKQNSVKFVEQTASINNSEESAAEKVQYQDNLNTIRV